MTFPRIVIISHREQGSAYNHRRNRKQENSSLPDGGKYYESQVFASQFCNVETITESQPAQCPIFSYLGTSHPNLDPTPI